MNAPAGDILLIGDRDRSVHGAIESALPSSRITRVNSVFDGIAELYHNSFASVVAPVEPLERRPEPAIRTLRELAGTARLVLFGHSTLEPLSRKMMDFGCDDYFLTPADPVELRQIFGVEPQPQLTALPVESPVVESASPLTLASTQLAESVLDAMLTSPGRTLDAVLHDIRKHLGDSFPIHFQKHEPEFGILAHPVRNSASVVGHLVLTRRSDAAGDRHLLAQIALILGKVAQLEERHAKLQRLAITDDLTGVFNGRYFNHFLSRIIEKARVRRFPVTLLLFDIDNFKRYNDTYGHGVGDEILRQTAALMKKCVREHDLVAAEPGDEFAVIFWEKEGPRTPRDPSHAGHSRVPSTPMVIASRFRKLISGPEFTALGAQGRGKLTISGGMSVFPYDASSPEALIEAADKALMFGAKKSGKNAISLVGDGGQINDSTEL
jgi:GGDEF domain-containing protein